MSSNQAPIVDRIRIIPRPSDFLDRNVGSSGELFFSKDTNTIRVYSGKDRGGFELAKTDFSNVDVNAAIGSLDLTSQKNKIRFHWNTLQELVFEVDPVAYHGMIAHVHEEARLYFAHAGQWVAVPITEDIPTDVSQLTDNTGLLTSGSWNDLTDKPLYLGANSITFQQGVTVNEFSSDTTLADQSDSAVPTERAVKVYVDTALENFEGGGGGGLANAFVTLLSQDGSFDVNSTGELTVVGGTNISTEVVTDSEQLTINVDPFAIEFLSNVSDTAPTSGQVLKWDGTQWAPGADVASGGAGLDADTLDGFDSTYYLDYNNFTNTPSVLTLTSLSIGNENAASGDGAISYDNTTGVFRYTPPDLSSYLTTESDTLATVTARGSSTNTAVTFSGGLTTSNITTTGAGTPGITSASGITFSAVDDITLSASGDVIIKSLTYPATDGTAGQVMTTDGAGNLSFTTISGGGSSDFLSLTDTPSSFGSAGQVVVVNSTADGLEFSTAGSGGEVNQNAFSNVAVSGQTTLQADTTTDTLTLIAGNNITITTDDATDSVTIASSTSTPDFSQLGEVTTASITVDKFYEHAYTTYYIDNTGATAYTFAPHYSGNNPTIFLLSGMTVAFDLNAIGGHPFELQDSTGTALTDASQLVHVSTTGTVSTGSSAQGQDSGTLYWRVPETTTSPPNYRYQCQNHVGMVGAITIKDLSSL